MDICGIDEAGRGCLAGPLVMVGAKAKGEYKIEELTDSKKISAKKREYFFDLIKEFYDYIIVFKDNNLIDEKGLSCCLRESLEEIKNGLKSKKYIFDGPHNYGASNLECIIKGDEKINEISASSIIAKVTRDRYMMGLEEKYDIYEFGKHKGYGTKKHKQLINKYGVSDLHRVSFKVKEK